MAPVRPAPPSPAPADPPWHALPPADVCARLETGPDGLTAAEAARRLEAFGPNRLAPSPPASALTLLVAQFRGVVTLLLVAAAAVSLALGEHLDAVAIGVVIALNAALGFTVELRARRAMEALLQLGSARATVIRDGQPLTIDAGGLVRGDVVELAAGQTVPADARVLEGTELRTNEAALTGESLLVAKTAEPAEPDAPLAERASMVYRGTTVAGGMAQAAVTATGDHTEVGRIGALTRSIGDERTPLERRLDQLGRRLVWLALGVAALVAVLGVLRGAPWGLMIETAIALAVAAVPEGLPAVATIALAVGLRRMARRHALVRRLSAVEALGSTTVVCTDKTRTLTTGEMTVVRVWTPNGEHAVDAAGSSGSPGPPEVTALFEVAARASRPAVRHQDRSGAATGDPMDLAVLRAAAAAGVDVEAAEVSEPVSRIPFSSARRFTAAFFDRSDGLGVCVKGAPGTVLAMSRRVRRAGGSLALSDEHRAAFLAANDRLAGEGLRVIAAAAGRRPAADDAPLDDLELVGLAGLMDPPAPGVRETIAHLKRAGLRTIMLTGDQQRTAEAIGRQLGLLSDAHGVVDGRTFTANRDATLAAQLGQLGAVSRITAEDKLTVVAALQARGDIVAMLGDGVNDAPALRKADVGVAMGGRGTDVAKEAAAIVLQDDRFETIAAAVEEGRVIGDNIRKFVFYLFSCNLAEILVLLVAEVAGLPPPLLPLQILYLNLVTDTFPALALAVEPGDREVMARPPRDPGEAILSAVFLRRVLFYASLITAATLGALVWSLDHPGADPATVAFMTLGIAQIAHLGNARSDHDVLHPRAALANPYALAAVAVSLILQTLPLAVAPLGRVLGVTPLDSTTWLVVLAGSACAAVAGQAIRFGRDRVREPR